MIKKIYRKAKNFVKKIQYYSLVFNKIEMTPEKMEYVLSGIDSQIREQFSIIYSPTNLLLKKRSHPERPVGRVLEDRLPTGFIKEIDYNALNNLSSNEDKVRYLEDLKNKMKDGYRRAVENLRLNHLKEMNEFYSQYVRRNVRDLFEKYKIMLDVSFTEGLRLNYVPLN